MGRKSLTLLILLFGASIYGSQNKISKLHKETEDVKRRERDMGDNEPSKLKDGPTKPSKPYITGEISWYSEEYCRKYNPSCLTASGERFSEDAFTVACSSAYSLGDYLRFSYRGSSVVAKCTDRGSFEDKYNRVADLSKAAFQKLAPLSKGIIEVKVERL